MPLNRMVTIAAFLATSSLVMLIFLVVSGRRTRLDTRLRDLSSNGDPDAYPIETLLDRQHRPHDPAQDRNAIYPQ